ncbi:MAG: hypothetical protein ACRDTH_22805 [Pseudonocardiaceae bacterium]
MQPGRGDKNDALFNGSEQIITIIRELYVRQSPDEPLPILSLVRPDLDEHRGFLPDISQHWFDGTEPCVPHVYVNLKAPPGQPDAPDLELPEATEDDVKQVREILLRLARRLEERSGGRFNRAVATESLARSTSAVWCRGASR